MKIKTIFCLLLIFLAVWASGCASYEYSGNLYATGEVTGKNYYVTHSTHFVPVGKIMVPQTISNHHYDVSFVWQYGTETVDDGNLYNRVQAGSSVDIVYQLVYSVSQEDGKEKKEFCRIDILNVVPRH